MDHYLHAIILGIIEGLTEFLPVSSTGHLIIGAKFLKLPDNNFMKLFETFIQIGAILAVIILQHKKILSVLTNLKQTTNQKFTLNVIIATIPAVLLGLLFSDFFKKHFFNIFSVSIALIIGGIIILFVDKPNNKVNENSIENINSLTALKIGLLQCLALIPGVSRSGATIIGGMYLGLPRVLATSFSFFLAIPIIFGASLHDLYKYRHDLNSNNINLLIIGSISALIMSWLCIKWLMKYISTHTFIVFAWYRIAFGLILLALYYSDVFKF